MGYLFGLSHPEQLPSRVLLTLACLKGVEEGFSSVLLSRLFSAPGWAAVADEVVKERKYAKERGNGERERKKTSKTPTKNKLQNQFFCPTEYTSTGSNDEGLVIHGLVQSLFNHLRGTVMCVKIHAWLASVFKLGELGTTLNSLLFEKKKIAAVSSVFFPESQDTDKVDTKHHWTIH